MKKIISAVAIVLILGACASNEPVKEVPVVDRTPGITAPTTSAATAQPTATQPVVGNPLTDPNNILSRRSVYFDYDSNVVKDEFRNLVQAHTKYLIDNKNARVRLEGSTDERGSREYNLALGQRRADAVKKIMVVLGVPEARLETISFGEEKPNAPGHDESAWSQNRRTDIVYQGE
jgi:peptidoglycan-associated lipoprotein